MIAIQETIKSMIAMKESILKKQEHFFCIAYSKKLQRNAFWEGLIGKDGKKDGKD